MALKCQYCGKGQNSKDRQRIHEKVCGRGDTTGSGHTRSQTTSQSHSVTSHSVTEETPNTNTELAVTQAPGHTVTSPLPPSVVSKETKKSVTVTVTGSVTSIPGPGATEVDPATKDREVVSYLSSRVDWMDDRERRFFHGVKYRITGGGNHISQPQREWLYEIKAVVEGLVADHEAELDRMAEASHVVSARNPQHVKEGCRFCEKTRRFQERMALEADISEIEAWHYYNVEALPRGQVATPIGEWMDPAVLQRVKARSLQGDPEALRVIKILGGLADA